MMSSSLTSPGGGRRLRAPLRPVRPPRREAREHTREEPLLLDGTRVFGRLGAHLAGHTPRLHTHAAPARPSVRGRRGDDSMSFGVATASLATAFFVPDRFHAGSRELIAGIHHAIAAEAETA